MCDYNMSGRTITHRSQTRYKHAVLVELDWR